MALQPEITFRVNLMLPHYDYLGPNTNERVLTLHSPDQFDNSPDRGRAASDARTSLISTLTQLILPGSNKVLKHGDEFTVNGMQAIYIRKTYAVGYAPDDVAFLEIVS